MKKYDYVIGIDPDTSKSGMALVIVDKKVVGVSSYTFPELLKKVHDIVDNTEYTSFCIVIELDRKTTHNWHLGFGDSARVAKQKGFSQGRCYQIAADIADYFRATMPSDVDVVEWPPLCKCWSGSDQKITADEFGRLKGISHMGGRTNQEERDAALLALVRAGIPLELMAKPNKK